MADEIETPMIEPQIPDPTADLGAEPTATAGDTEPAEHTPDAEFEEPALEPEFADSMAEPELVEPVTEPGVTTGHAEIDAALGRLDDLDGLPVDRHGEVYDELHGRLRDALTAAATPAPESSDD